MHISEEQRTFLVLGTFLRFMWEAATAAKLARKKSSLNQGIEAGL